MKMLHDRINPDRDTEAKYMRVRTYVLCIFGEFLWIVLYMIGGAAIYDYLYVT